jgi:tetratricopeptide (TPR) repeat protein
MQRYKLAGCVAVLLLAGVSMCGGADNAAGAGPENTTDKASDPFAMVEDPRIPRLITQLGDRDPVKREDAIDRLRNMGEAARPALRRSLSTATAQTRPEIDRILLHVPWIKSGDADLVQQAFMGYTEMDADARCARIRDAWVTTDTLAAPDALMRIILNDPSAAVRWEAANALQLTIEENDPLGKQAIDLVSGVEGCPQAYLPPDQNAPLIAIAGWAQRDNPARCAELLYKALKIEEEDPSAFRGQTDFVFNWLVDRCNGQHRYAQAIQLLREQASRTSWDEIELPTAVGNLFAAQADHGPDGRFYDDLRMYEPYFSHSELIYTFSRLASRKVHPLAGEAIADVALLMSGTSAEDHYAAGRFLLAHRWNAAAEHELKWCLALSDGDDVNVYFQLSSLADERTDDLNAARYLETGLQKLTNSGGMTQVNRFGKRVPWTPDQAWAEVYWHYLRAARDSGDIAAAKANLEKLLGTDDGATTLRNSPGMAADIVPAVAASGRTDLANSMFDSAYTALNDQVIKAPDDAMAKNNLAWLCACCDKRLDDAKRLADAAVAASPDEGACLDTQAEVYFRMGKASEAVTIETKALQARPDDVYMARQLKRFQAAAGKKLR